MFAHRGERATHLGVMLPEGARGTQPAAGRGRLPAVPTARLAALPEVVLDGGVRAAEAATPLARLRGLAGLSTIEPGEALLLRRCRSVHTLGMRFALDLVWLDAGGRILRRDAGVDPGHFRGCRRAGAVVETRAGEGERVACALAAASGDGGLLLGLPRRSGATRGLLDEAGSQRG